MQITQRTNGPTTLRAQSPSSPPSTTVAAAAEARRSQQNHPSLRWCFTTWQLWWQALLLVTTSDTQTSPPSTPNFTPIGLWYYWYTWYKDSYKYIHQRNYSCALSTMVSILMHHFKFSWYFQHHNIMALIKKANEDWSTNFTPMTLILHIVKIGFQPH